MHCGVEASLFGSAVATVVGRILKEEFGHAVRVLLR